MILLRSVFIIAIVAVAMIGVMVPSVYAGHSTVEETLRCSSDINYKLSQELETPLDLDIVKNNVLETARDCVKDHQHQIQNACNIAKNEAYILESIAQLTEIGKTDHIAKKQAELKISKWTCSEDTLDAEFNITSKFGIAKSKYDNRILAEEHEYQEYVDYNKGRLTWVTDCSEKGKIIIYNIKEYGDDGVTLKKIDNYNYQILDDMSNPIINEIDHEGEIILLHQEYPEARYIQMSGEKGLDERRNICSNYFEIKFLDVDLVCPILSEYDVIENASNDDQQYSIIPKNSATFEFQNNEDILGEINVETHYSDGQIIPKHNSYSILVKNENSMISHVVFTADDHYAKEITYSCELTPTMEKILIQSYEASKITQAKSEETKKYCNDDINGCRVTYN
jgi:hypothetical protein